MKDIKIEHSVVSVGDNSPIYIHSEQAIQWQTLEDDCFNLLSKLAVEDIQRFQLKQLTKKIFHKDTNGLKEFMKKHAELLTSNIISVIVSQYFIQFLSSL